MEDIDMFGKEVTNVVTSTSSKHLLGIIENAIHLDEHRGKVFHTMTGNLLYVTNRSRPDIDTTVMFVCTRASFSDKDYWKQLRPLLVFEKGTINDKQIIEVTGMNGLWAWFDDLYAVHEYMRSQMGG